MDNTVFVIARNPQTARIMVGGCGLTGTRTRWRDELDYHRNYRGYDQAKIVTPEDFCRDDCGETG